MSGQHAINVTDETVTVADCTFFLGTSGDVGVYSDTYAWLLHVRDCDAWFSTLLALEGAWAVGVRVEDCSLRTFTGNVVGVNLDGPDIFDFAVVRLRSEQFAAPAGAVRVASAHDGQIVGCWFGSGSTDHTVQLIGASGIIVEGNRFEPTEEDLAKDNVFLQGASRCIVRDNVFVPDPATRYGVNISDAASVDNVVVGNYMRGPATFGTAPINDSGTGTHTTYPGAAAPNGDNFV